MSTDNVVGITLGEVKGLFADLMEKLSSETAHEWVAALKLFLKKQDPWPVAKVKEVVQRVSDLLKYLSTHSLPKVGESIARDKFVVNTKNGAELKISYLGDNFQKWFLDKVEKDVSGCEMKVSKLLKNSPDKPILDELADKAENALAHVYEFLKTADKGVWYIFYVKDVNDRLRAVNADWDVDGWHVGADSVGDRYERNAGNHVVSR